MLVIGVRQLVIFAIALLLLWQFPRAGSLPILSVIWAAMIASSWPPRTVVAGLLANNLAAWWILQDAGYRSPLMSVVLFACFQLFAVLTVHYARSAERSRDALALVATCRPMAGPEVGAQRDLVDAVAASVGRA